MEIYVKGYERSSLVEWPGKIVAIIFTGGCTFRCPFCHNGDMVLNPEKFDDISFFEILDDLKLRKDWIDAVEITGGEPTIFPHLKEILRILKSERFAVKLDTNGTNPALLSEILKENLVDYVAMDIKNSKRKYAETSGIKVDINKIEKSIKLIQENAPDYEFRTTVLPRLHSKEDIEEIGKWLKGSKRYFLQKFKKGHTLDPSFNEEKSFSDKEMKELAVIAGKYFEDVQIR